MSLKFRCKITIKSLFSKEKSTYSTILSIILPTYSDFTTANIPTYSIFKTINMLTCSVPCFISWRNLDFFARLRRVITYLEASSISAARSSSLITLSILSKSSVLLTVCGIFSKYELYSCILGSGYEPIYFDVISLLELCAQSACTIFNVICIPAEYKLYTGCIQNVFRPNTNCIQAEYKLYTAGTRSVYSFDTPAASIDTPAASIDTTAASIDTTAA